MTEAERDHIVRELAKEFGSRACAGSDPGASSGPVRSPADGSRSVAHGVLDHMVRAGASRFGVFADQPERYAFSACDLAPPLARMIDHTALKPETTEEDIASLCSEAERYCFASVCVNPSWVGFAADRLRGTPVRVCTVVGFPLGATATGVKAVETETAVQDGATEIDMVLNVGRLRSGHTDYVEEDIRAVVTAARRTGAATVKVILETALLTDEEKVVACVLARNAGADFVKTSTGFSKGGATAADVALMRRVVGSSMGVKASGGVRSRADAERMIASGATRIGASASVAIIQDREGSGSY